MAIYKVNYYFEAIDEDIQWLGFNAYSLMETLFYFPFFQQVAHDVSMPVR